MTDTRRRGKILRRLGGDLRFFRFFLREIMGDERENKCRFCVLGKQMI
ncbi:unnamed protein product [Arabidopsis halleri]